jgi:uncharacterized protein YndB with AHSA1/START domain
MAPAKATGQSQETLVLKLSHRFKAPPAAVFRAWTDPEAFAQWMGPEGVKARDVKIDLRVGGGYSLVMDGSEGGVYPLSGEYMEIDPPKRLVFTLVWGHGDLKGLEMLVALNFAEDKGGTLMTLVQERIPSEQSRASHTHGWEGSFRKLEAFLSA